MTERPESATLLGARQTNYELLIAQTNSSTCPVAMLDGQDRYEMGW